MRYKDKIVFIDKMPEGAYEKLMDFINNTDSTEKEGAAPIVDKRALLDYAKKLKTPGTTERNDMLKFYLTYAQDISDEERAKITAELSGRKKSSGFNFGRQFALAEDTEEESEE